MKTNKKEITRQELAEKLNNREYREEITQEEEQLEYIIVNLFNWRDLHGIISKLLRVEWDSTDPNLWLSMQMIDIELIFKDVNY